MKIGRDRPDTMMKKTMRHGCIKKCRSDTAVKYTVIPLEIRVSLKFRLDTVSIGCESKTERPGIAGPAQQTPAVNTFPPEVSIITWLHVICSL